MRGALAGQEASDHLFVVALDHLNGRRHEQVNRTRFVPLSIAHVQRMASTAAVHVLTRFLQPLVFKLASVQSRLDALSVPRFLDSTASEKVSIEGTVKGYISTCSVTPFLIIFAK